LAAPPDVLLITVDTLRADAPGFAGNESVETPWLDRLAADGRVFDNAHAHNVVTLPSHTNMLTGRLPYEHGVRDNQGFRLGEEWPTLATLLRAAGYRTGAFVSAYPLDSIFGLARGFEHYDDRYPKGEGAGFALPERRGDETVERALAWWREAAGVPRFLWLHLFDPHAPYEPPSPLDERYAETPYLGEVVAVDGYLEPLLAPLLSGEAPPTLVVLTADHGESLGEHGELTHGLFAYEATLRIPLVLWGVGVTPGRDDRAARHVDLLPTVLAAAGLQSALPEGLPGRSLLAPAGEPADTYFESLSTYLNRGWAPLRGLLREGRKLIALPLPELYDLDRDPGEQHNLVRAARRLAGELRDALPKAALEPPRPTGEDAAVTERLSSLGYLGGAAPATENFGPADDPKNLVDLDRKMHRAIEVLTAGDLPTAAALAREVVAARPTMALGQSLLAQILLEGGQREEAVRAMEAARRLGATTPSLDRQLGLTLAELGRHGEALTVLEPLAAGDDVEALSAYALALLEAGRLDAAELALDRLRTLDPEHPAAPARRALLELRRGRFEEARAAAERALALNDRLGRTWNDLGVALFQLGREAEALDAWQRAVELEPHLFDALYNLGTKALAADQPERARAALERFVAVAPEARYGADLRRARVLLARLRRGAS
jgi:arylsulfatase A-like enzyme/Flp pilus assembly protein TadD